MAISLASAPACGDDNEEGTSDAELLQKRWGELTDSEITRACDLANVAPVGEYKCEDASAEAFGETFNVFPLSECADDVKQFPPECPVTVQQGVACHEAIQVDACAALASGGACDLFPGEIEALCN